MGRTEAAKKRAALNNLSKIVASRYLLGLLLELRNYTHFTLIPQNGAQRSVWGIWKTP